MTDPVSDELARRTQAPWPWRSSLIAALAAHLALAATVLLTPSGPRKRLILPSVQVRLGVSLPAPPAAPRAAIASTAASEERPAAARPAKPKPRPEPHQERKPPRQPAKTAPARAAAPGRARELPAPPPSEAQENAASAADRLPQRAGEIAVGGGAAATDETFPYAYYLDRLLGMIEANWFRPPVPPGTKGRVFCRVDRAGRLLEAGVEESSGVPSFDRAALRAVYASAPFPPLPQGFGGTTLTLHLEFGQ